MLKLVVPEALVSRLDACSQMQVSQLRGWGRDEVVLEALVRGLEVLQAEEAKRFPPARRPVGRPARVVEPTDLEEALRLGNLRLQCSGCGVEVVVRDEDELSAVARVTPRATIARANAKAKCEVCRGEARVEGAVGEGGRAAEPRGGQEEAEEKDWANDPGFAALVRGDLG